MSAEIADWLNEHAHATGLPAVELIGIRPTGRPVTYCSPDELDAEHARLTASWENVRLMQAGEVWIHKGIEYDAVLVDSRGMDDGEIYLAASRAAHELVVCTSA